MAAKLRVHVAYVKGQKEALSAPVWQELINVHERHHVLPVGRHYQTRWDAAPSAAGTLRVVLSIDPAVEATVSNQLVFCWGFSSS